MNGKSAKLLRKMKSSTSRDKRSWNNLSADQRHRVKLAVADCTKDTCPPLAALISFLR